MTLIFFLPCSIMSLWTALVQTEISVDCWLDSGEILLRGLLTLMLLRLYINHHHQVKFPICSVLVVTTKYLQNDHQPQLYFVFSDN